MARAIRSHAGRQGSPLVVREGTRLTFERRPTEYAGWLWCTGVVEREGAAGKAREVGSERDLSRVLEAVEAGWVPEGWVRIEGTTCVVLRDYDATELPLEAGEEVAVKLRESGWAWVRKPIGAEGWVPLECLGEITGGGTVPSGAGGGTPYRDRRYYGRVYHILFDRALDAGRSAVVNLVGEGSSVLDIASGTGDLCFALRREKNCRVVGIDLSPRMLAFAAKRNCYGDVKFTRQDATNLADFAPGAFDYATVTLLLHELAREARAQVLREALRVAGRVIVVDWIAPLPWSLEGLSVRFIEWVGRHHYHNFKDYLARGGIDGVLRDLEPRIVVEHRAALRHTCREIVAFSLRKDA